MPLSQPLTEQSLIGVMTLMLVIFSPFSMQQSGCSELSCTGDFSSAQKMWLLICNTLLNHLVVH